MGQDPLPAKKNRLKGPGVVLLSLATGLGGGYWLFHKQPKTPDCPDKCKVTLSKPEPQTQPATSSGIHKPKHKSGKAITTHITPTHIVTKGPKGLSAKSALSPKDVYAQTPNAATPQTFRQPYVRPQQAADAGPPPPPPSAGNNGYGPDNDFVPDDGLNTRMCTTYDGYEIPCGSFGNQWGVWGRGGLFIEIDFFRHHHHRDERGHCHYDGPKEHIQHKDDAINSKREVNGFERVAGAIPQPKPNNNKPGGEPAKLADSGRSTGTPVKATPVSGTTFRTVAPLQPNKNKYEHIGVLPRADIGSPYDRSKTPKDEILSTFSGETGQGAPRGTTTTGTGETPGTHPGQGNGSGNGNRRTTKATPQPVTHEPPRGVARSAPLVQHHGKT